MLPFTPPLEQRRCVSTWSDLKEPQLAGPYPPCHTRTQREMPPCTMPPSATPGTALGIPSPRLVPLSLPKERCCRSTPPPIPLSHSEKDHPLPLSHSKRDAPLDNAALGNTRHGLGNVEPVAPPSRTIYATAPFLPPPTPARTQREMLPWTMPPSATPGTAFGIPHRTTLHPSP